MQQELAPLDVTDLPRLAEAARAVSVSGRPRRIVRGDEVLAVLQPAKKPRRAASKGRPVPADDPLWSIIGITHADGPGDVSRHKRSYLAQWLLLKHS